ncbi:MAG: sugar ABC transporter permease [Epulopiscium sp. Nele67-Bin002]|nr:MAG: sugar ABC transporter permease [Epulopiscium sp. Nele67-Bin002]
MDGTRKKSNIFFQILFSIIAILYMFPIALILMNSFKTELAITTDRTFELLNANNFAGFDNYFKAITSQGFAQSFWYSFYITISSVFLIILCCSMCAWYITRSNNKFTKALYYLFVFSIIVPFQMVMFSISQIADRLSLNSPYTICIMYLGFGAGLAVFMFCGFVKGIPLEIEEAASIDGCSMLETFFKVVLPILKPTMITVAILQSMWVWNDYLLPTYVLDIKKYRTIPMLIQYFRGSYGSVELGPMMASIMLTIIPIVIFYLFAQRYIIEGVVAGAVKG